jgi:hypothetical protein
MTAETGCFHADYPSRPSPWSRADKIALSLVLAWVALCFAQVAGFGFVNWDDRDFVLQNPLVVNPGSVPFLHHLTTPEVGYPIPVTMLSYRIEYALVGFDHPWVQHLVNVIFHLGSVALLFAIARVVGAGTVGSALAACLLGLHPAVAEPVSWLTGRKDVLALFFALATLRLALPTGDRASRARRIARAVTFLLALLCKPVAVALTPMLVLIGAGQQDRSLPFARRIAIAVAHNSFEIAFSLALLPIAYVNNRALGATRDGEQVATSLRSAWYGLGVHLAIIAGIEPPCVRHLVSLPPPFTPRFDLLPLIAVAMAASLWRFIRRCADRSVHIVVAGAVAWSIFAYLPSSGLVPIRRFISDSYVYPVLPGVGVALGLALEAVLALRPGRLRLVRRALVPALAVGLGLLAIPSSGRFRTTGDLWADAMEHYPTDWRMCRNWAVAMMEIGGPAKSLAATDLCIGRFGPANLEKNRAVALFELGRQDEAGPWMRQALARDPSDLDAPAELLRLARETALRDLRR